MDNLLKEFFPDLEPAKLDGLERLEAVGRVRGALRLSSKQLRVLCDDPGPFSASPPTLE